MRLCVRHRMPWLPCLQTEVLAAARAALASPGPSGERGSSRGGAALADAPGSSGSSDGGGEPPARQPWSLPSEDQDATRHVLQSALDQMQRSGAKISSPRDDEFFDRPMAGSGGGSRRDRDIRRGRGSSSSSGGGGGGSADDGHGPAPDWATSLLGALCVCLLLLLRWRELGSNCVAHPSRATAAPITPVCRGAAGSDDFGGASFPFPTSGPGGKIKPSAGTAFAEPQLQLHQVGAGHSRGRVTACVVCHGCPAQVPSKGAQHSHRRHTEVLAHGLPRWLAKCCSLALAAVATCRRLLSGPPSGALLMRATRR
jgi:hypothetical protein